MTRSFGNPATRTTLGLEALELREVPSIALVGDQLQVTGGDYNDVVTIEATYDPGSEFPDHIVASRTEIRQTPLGTVLFSEARTFDIEDVTSIRVDLGNGTNSYTGGPLKHTTVYGGSGADTMTGGYATDVFYGNGGDDILNGGGGTDFLFGGAGNDSIHGDDGNDFAWGGDGYDAIYGGAGNDVLRGEAGNDSIYGQGGDDSLFGGDGDDYLVGGLGFDTIDGGSGDNTIWQGDPNVPHAVDQHW